MTIEEWLGKDNEIGISIWERKYQHNGENFEQWLDRISGKKENVKQIIRDKKFLFGGRILANRGLQNESKITYSNCYVLSAPEDNLESIFETAKKLARTYSYGGGVGVDLSKLAPKGAQVRNAAKESSGAVSFMDLYSMVTGLISQNGRRGALMLSMSCNHPDIEDFINIKSDLERVTKANTSIRVLDDFMDAVIRRQPYTLRFRRAETGENIVKTIDAYELFKKMAFNNWDMGEPGMLFWDRISKHNLLSGFDNFEYTGTNPCAEEPLPAGGSCLLGSINLVKFVKHSPAGTIYFDFDDLAETVYAAVEALNDVLDEGMPLHPLQEQRDSVHDWRQIGLGIMGLADMLIEMGVQYGSAESIELCDTIAKDILNYAAYASCNLAAQYGAFPNYDFNCLSKSAFFRNNLEDNIKEIIKKYGLRNSQLLTIAPTGTLSTMLGISGGIEPIFANYYTRKTESLYGEDKYYKVYTPIVKRYMEKNSLIDDSKLPNYFITAGDLDYHKRIQMQGTWQKYIDASISSTVNLPEEATVEDIMNIYIEAWKNGLKGITVFRNNCRRVGILTTEPKKEDKVEDADVEVTRFDYITPVSRKELGTTHGNTYCRHCACGTLYITVNCDDDGNLVETFIESSKGGICKANTAAVNRMVSVALRSGVKVDEIIDQLKGIYCPACAKTSKEVDGLSCPDIMAKTLKAFYYGEEDEKPRKNLVKSKKVTEKEENKEICPECGKPLRREGGCVICGSCGWSKCG